ncbi:MAG TPA: hypothetical protein VFX58_05495 [Chitinophagaceae bacterium]|nr:hypothetical protein [Chitinophagaceae bacterium]
MKSKLFAIGIILFGVLQATAQVSSSMPGLQFVFERPDLPLADTVLCKYTGRYGSASGIPFEIRNENNHLVLYWANGNKDKLHAISGLVYYSNAEYMKVHFKKDNDKVKGFEWERYGSTIFISKIF